MLKKHVIVACCKICANNSNALDPPRLSELGLRLLSLRAGIFHMWPRFNAGSQASVLQSAGTISNCFRIDIFDILYFTRILQKISSPLKRVRVQVAGRQVLNGLQEAAFSTDITRLCHHVSQISSYKCIWHRMRHAKGTE